MSLRVSIHQPALPLYRIPVFQRLATSPDLAIRVLYEREPGIPEAPVVPFDSQLFPRRALPVGPRIYWASAHSALGRTEPTDVVVLNWNIRYASLAPTILRLRREKVGVVLWGHGYSKRASRTNTAVRKAVARLADALVVYDLKTKQELERESVLDPERVFVAPNTIDQTPLHEAAARFRAAPEQLAGFRAQQRLEPPCFLFVSRLIGANRICRLIEAIEQLTEEGRSVRCVIIGSGPEREQLRRSVERRSLTKEVTFVAGTYDENELAPYFLCADALVYPSNAGLSLQHAFAYGLPVIIGDDESLHNPEARAVTHEGNGLTFSHGDPASLAAALRRIADDRDLASKLKEGARSTAAEYSIDEMVAQLAAAIRFAYVQAKRAS